jgi:hypothetical protein
MKIQIRRKINSAVAEIEIDDREDKIALSKAIVLSANDVCDLCKSEKIVWQQNKAKSEKGEFTYIKRRCLACGATSTLGEYQPAGTGYFWKKFEQYQPSQPIRPADQPKAEIPVLEDEENVNVENIPF